MAALAVFLLMLLLLLLALWASLQQEQLGPAPPMHGTAAAAAATATGDSCSPHCEAVLLQGFGWESHRGGQGGRHWWAALLDHVPQIKAAGFTHVWLPPPSQSVAPQGYMPAQLYNLSSSYGGQEELQQLVAALRAEGITPVADIVINHRCADQLDAKGRWMLYRDDVDHPGRRLDWGEWAITANDPAFAGQGAKDTGQDFLPAPDLDHTNEAVQGGLLDWLRWLNGTLGLQGWRLDFVKGYDAQHAKQYVEQSLGAGAFCVGENWVDLRWSGGRLDYDQSEAIARLAAWAGEAGCLAFDFPTKGIVQEAVRRTEYDRLRGAGGAGPGLLGSAPGRAVTFVDNHDTGSTQQLWPWSSDRVLLGYAYILTHPGISCVFWEHMFDWGLAGSISELIALRKRSGIRADSPLEVLAAERDLYVARVNGRVVVKLGPRMDLGPLLPDPREWRLAASGADFAVWERGFGGQGEGLVAAQPTECLLCMDGF